MEPPTVFVPQCEWVARLREAGIDLRTGSGVLTREPAASFTLPPGYRPPLLTRIGTLLRTVWKAGTRRLPLLTHAKRHATLP
jgi:hypothetical protein